MALKLLEKSYLIWPKMIEIVRNSQRIIEVLKPRMLCMDAGFNCFNV